MRKALILISALLALTAVTLSSAQENKLAKIDIITESDSVLPGKTIRGAIRFQLEKDVHTYWINPGDSGLALIVDWQLPAGWKASSISWPHPERFELSGIVNYGYENEVIFPVTFTVPKDAAMGTAVNLRAKIDALVCKDMCLPVSTTASATVQVIPLPPIIDTRVKEKLDRALASVPLESMPAGWAVKAEETETDIAIIITPPAAQGIKEINFFPLLPDIIAYTSEQTLTKTQDGRFVLSIQKAKGFDRQSTLLSGVIVINHGKDLPRNIAPAFRVNAAVSKAAAGSFDFLKTTATDTAKTTDTQTADAPKAKTKLPVVLLFAFFGGLMLNLMPCVLPMLSIKILGFVNQAQESALKLKLHGLVFGAGIVLSFWALAGTLLILRAGGQGLGWGFQLQSPYVLGTLIFLFFLIGLNLFGIFEVGTGLAAMVGNKTSQSSGLTGSFFSGVLMTVVATPCTAPFMGSALGYALTLNAFSAMLVFTALALGLAVPYTVISFFPPLLKFVPKPGAWMDLFKQFFGFIMLAVVIELGWVFGKMQGLSGLTSVFLVLLYLAFGAWLYNIWGAPTKSAKTRKIAGFVFVFFILSSLTMIINTASGPGVSTDGQTTVTKSGVQWQKFSPETLENALLTDQPVFVAFSAAWCLTCTVNDSRVFSKDEMREEFEKHNVIAIKADWTNKNEAITKQLASYGRSSVPLYVVYSKASNTPKILPEIVSIKTIKEAIEAASNSK